MNRVDNDEQSSTDMETNLYQQEEEREDRARRVRDHQDQLRERREMKRFGKNRHKRGRFDDE